MRWARGERRQVVGSLILMSGITLLLVSVLSMMVGCVLGQPCEAGPIPRPLVLPTLAASVLMMAFGFACGATGWRLRRGEGPRRRGGAEV